MMMVEMPKVKYFATLRHRVGIEEESVEDLTLSEVFRRVAIKIPDFLDFDGKPTGLYVVLINDIDYRLYGEDYKLKNDDCVTIIPVIHGG